MNTQNNQKKTKHPGGRPKKNIDYDMVKKLASIMCTEEEISSILEISVRTLQRDDEFCRIYKNGIESGKASVRRAQFKLLSAGNATMAVWLGKQYLNQKDHIREEVDVTQPIKLVVDDVDLKA